MKGSPQVVKPSFLVVKQAVDKALDAFLEQQRKHMREISPELIPLADELALFIHRGKRLRPLFAYWGWRAAGGTDNEEGVITAAAALEWLHTGALIHDDVMDQSDTRRGRASMHRIFAEKYAKETTEKRHHGRAAFGEATAILLGDLCMTWAGTMLHTSAVAPRPLAEARSVLEEMHTDVVLGQYLDVAGYVTGDLTSSRARTMLLYKSAKYTVEQPLLVGIALSGTHQPSQPDALVKTLQTYGLCVGEAFQLRDDVLGVFGDPAMTGKPAGDDLREGKHTPLITETIEQADSSERDFLLEHLGDPSLTMETIERMRTAIIESGALAQTERRIANLTAEACSVLEVEKIPGDAVTALNHLATAATQRTA